MRGLVDVDVRQVPIRWRWRSADHAIDLLVTPDPVYSNGLLYTPMIAFGGAQPAYTVPRRYASAEDLREEVLLTHPVSKDNSMSTLPFKSAAVVPKQR